MHEVTLYFFQIQVFLRHSIIQCARFCVSLKNLKHCLENRICFFCVPFFHCRSIIGTERDSEHSFQGSSLFTDFANSIFVHKLN